MSDEPLTKEEQDYEDDLIKRIKEIDQKLSAFQQTTGPTSNDPKMMKAIEDLPVINQRGKKVISTEEMRKNYENAPPFLRIFQLPYCKQSIVGKAKFWLVGGVVASVTWEYKKLLQNNLGWKDLSRRKVGRTYLLVTLAGISFSLVESLLFDDYCNIDSYHYNEKIDRKLRMQRLKKESQNL